MRRIAPLFVLLALSVSLCSSAIAQSIAVDPSTYDFGDMMQEETRTFTATIHNNGGGLLIITDVVPDCGCTIPEMKVKEILPGESAPLEIQFNSKNFTGKVIKAIKIHSNDPKSSVANLVLTANIHSLLDITPDRRVAFLRSLRGESESKVVNFTAMEGHDLEIKADRTLQQLFQVEARNHVDGNPSRAELVVTRPADMAPGNHHDIVRVETNVKEMPTVDLDLNAQVFSHIEVRPRRVSFRFQPQFQINIRLAPFNKEDTFKILSVTTDLPELNIGKTVAIPNGAYAIPLTGEPIGADAPRAIQTKGRIQGSITIKTDLKAMPEIIVPVTYMVRM